MYRLQGVVTEVNNDGCLLMFPARVEEFEASNEYMKKHGKVKSLPTDGFEITRDLYTQYELAVRETRKAKNPKVVLSKKVGDVVYVPATAWPDSYKQVGFPYPDVRLESAYFKGTHLHIL